LSLVYPYLKALEDAFVLKKMYRYNLLTEKLLRTNIRYFIGDHALRNAVQGISDDAPRGVFENILLHDLERRGCTVYSAKLENHVIDFAVKLDDGFIFLQTLNPKIDDEQLINEKIKTLEEISKFENIKIQKKFLICFDEEYPLKDYEPDISCFFLPNFLLLETF
jgi:predicted AAA+ superfamily ATPase